MQNYQCRGANLGKHLGPINGVHIYRSHVAREHGVQTWSTLETMLAFFLELLQEDVIELQTIDLNYTESKSAFVQKFTHFNPSGSTRRLNVNKICN